MSKERMMILDMLESGKITPKEAHVLFQALGEEWHAELPAVSVAREHEVGSRRRCSVERPRVVREQHDGRPA